MMTQSMISARTIGSSSFVSRRPSVSQRVARSTPKRVVAVSAAFPGAQAAKYMSEAFTQIFTTPEDDSDIDWKASPFTGDIPHHGDSSHLRRSSAIYLSAKLEKMAEAAVTEEDRKALSSLASQVSSVIDSNFKTSGENTPESFGGELGFSGDVRHRGQRSH